MKKGNRAEHNSNREERVIDDIKARNHHIAQLRHIIGSPRHHIPHPLTIMEGLTLAQQTQVQLITSITRKTFPQHLSTQTGAHIHTAAKQYSAQESERDDNQAAHISL